MKPVLVTRAEPGAARTMKRLRERGVTPINAATARIAYREASMNLDVVSALAFTSPNGVDAFAHNSDRRDLQVMTVGAVTAAAARAAGFISVTSADGDGAALVRLIASAPPDGPVLHISGAAQAFSLTEALAGIGVRAAMQILYDAVETGPLEPEIVDALEAGAIILVHSPLGAARFAARVEEAGCRKALARCQVAALSAKAAAPLTGMSAGRVRSAETPDEEALFRVLDQMLAKS
ncbi:uroporphyrinogen-III synthase [Maricaulaceae bacterium MS644]